MRNESKELSAEGRGGGAAIEPERGAAIEPERGSASVREKLAIAVGLHPLVAFGMFACDWMLFGGEAASGGIGLAVTVPVALALMIPCILIQRYSFRDSWGAAIGKGMLVGVLTAIPMPLGSPATLAGGVIGLLRPKKPARLPPPRPPELSEGAAGRSAP